MYPISPLYSDYLRRHDREFLVRADINGETYTNATIVDFSIENNLSMSEGFEIGTAIPSKLTLSMRLKETIPANARIKLYLALSLEGMTWNDAAYPWESMNIPWEAGATEWLPLGEFYVDSREKINDIWRFTCYDKLVWGDVPYVSSLTYPTSQKAVFDEICGRLGYVYDSSVVINPGYMIQAGPAGFTMRQVLAYIAGLNSASIFIDKAGTLKFKRFAASAPPVFEMRVSDYIRVKQTNPVKTYTRVVVTYDTEDDLSYSAGSGDENHTLKLENPFATQAMANDLLATLNGFSYLPLTMDARGFPQLEHGDVLGFSQLEGASWLETITSWQDTHLPWDGIVDYKSIILRQTLSFKGGLKLRIDAPSVSEQQSEFQLEGSLSQQVNKLNKDALKEGKAYFGVTVTRREGLIVEREDHRSKVILNSDVLSFQANGQDRIYFDPVAGRYKFNGTLEATDGIFSGNLQAAGGTFRGDLQAAGGTFTGTLRGVDGDFSGELRAARGTFAGNLSAAGGTFTGTLVGVDGTFSGTITAATINGGTINGSTIIGSSIKTSASGRRIEIDSSGFRTYDSYGNNRIRINTGSDSGVSAISFYGSNGGFAGEINSYQAQNQLNIISDSIFIGSNSTSGPVNIQGYTTFNGFAHFSYGVSGIKLDISDIRGLQAELENIRYMLRNHTHSVNIGTHNHGNRDNQNWGGTFTTSTP
ncbi:hypothetical protein ABEV00_27520 [Paenibacillus thiaminolyticus]|uniref:hypothetical protein n=1 Tax=Paenibacillus thiaminolyticus TaxID=49283 RepID=UPI003D299607